MEESILNTIKKMLGPTIDDTGYDTELIVYINAAFSVVRQLGDACSNGFRVEDCSTTWSEFSSNQEVIDMVTTYIYMKVKLMFDPPTASSALESLQTLVSEFEWRINADTDSEFQNGV